MRAQVARGSHGELTDRPTGQLTIQLSNSPMPAPMRTSRALSMSFRCLIACVVVVGACDRHEAPSGRETTATASGARPPVALYGTWIRARPQPGDTLLILKDGRAEGPSIDPELGFGRTTRWEVLGIGMLCLGDARSMTCRGLRVNRDTLHFADRHGSVYLRTR